MRIFQTGRKLSPESREKMRQAKLALSALGIAPMQRPDVLAKAKAARARPEIKAKMQRKFTDEHKAALSKAAFARHARAKETANGSIPKI